MSGYDFEDAGSFSNESDAQNWALRQGVSLSDIRFSYQGKSVRLEIRRKGLEGRDIHNQDRAYGRSTGW